MIAYLLITALTVSIDSFLCGFSLSISHNKKFSLVIIITLTVFAMCTVANYATYALTEHLTQKTASLGGIILILTGFINLLKKDKDNKHNKGSFITQALMTGFAVGLDGALANLSLALMKINYFYVPVTIAIMHGLMIFLSIVTAQSCACKKLERFSFVAPLMLIALGTIKIFSGF